MKGRTGLRVAAGAAAGVAVLAGVRAIRAAGSNGAHAAHENKHRTYTRSITIYRPPTEVYMFWRNLSTLALAVERVLRVEPLDNTRSRWVIQGPGKDEFDFVADIVVDEPGKVLAWRTEESPVPHHARVEFSEAPGGRGTEVRVWLSYEPPAGGLGAAIARLSGDEPDQLLRTGLRRIKQVIECGEVIRVEGQPKGRGPIRERISELVEHRRFGAPTTPGRGGAEPAAKQPKPAASPTGGWGEATGGWGGAEPTVKQPGPPAASGWGGVESAPNRPGPGSSGGRA
jgi:uncharacterized membrane protein